jgi:molecular chaperone DnaK
MEVSIPSISGSFHSGRNFYSRQEGQIDFSQAAKLIAEDRATTLKRLDDMSCTIEDERLQQAREKLNRAGGVPTDESDPEVAKHAMDDIQEAKRLLALARKAHLKTIRQLELEKVADFFNQSIRQYARPSEESTFDNLIKTSQRAVGQPNGDFEAHLDLLREMNLMILWRQDWFIIDRFKALTEAVHLFPDARQHAQLVSAGNEALQANDMDKVRQILVQLHATRVSSSSDDEVMAGTNILAG